MLAMVLIQGCAGERAKPPMVYPARAANLQIEALECPAAVCWYHYSFDYVGYAADIVSFYQSRNYICKHGEAIDSLSFDINGESWRCEGTGDMSSDIVVGFPRFDDQQAERSIQVRATISWPDKLFP